jgi:HSP20 family protein
MVTMAIRVIGKSRQGQKSERTFDRPSYPPSVNIFERENELVLKADMPGVAPGDIVIEVERDILTIFGEIVDPRPRDSNCLLQELASGDYYRRFRLTGAIDAKKIFAELANGILTIHLPKSSLAMASNIQMSRN